MNASNRRIVAILTVVAWATFLPTASPAGSAAPISAGDLDPSFGENGTVTTDLGPEGESVNAIAVQPDGKIVAAGEAAWGAEFGLVRYNPDGTLDLTFGDGGTVATDIPPSGAYALAIQADGGIVAAGGGRRFALVRYAPDGDLDPTFGGDGVVTTNFNPEYDLAYGVAIQTDGKIVAAGVSSIEARPYFDDTKIAVARYNADGSLDTSFGGDGRVTTNYTGTYDAAFAVLIQTDGRIVVAGTAGAYRRFALARYNPDGSRDSGFGDMGKVTTRFIPHGPDQFATAIAVQADGRLVAVGTETTAVGFALARFESDGALDPTFGEDGMVTTDFLTRHDLGYVGGWARGVAIQADGKIVAAGGAPVGSGGDTEFALARYQPDGTLDASFGGDGRITTEWSTDGNDSALAIAIQSDGKIVAGGRSSDGPDGAFALARYLA
jgi:uncharacterized delta-60 repeat protein